MPEYQPEIVAEEEGFEDFFPYQNEEVSEDQIREEMRQRLSVFGAGLEKTAEEQITLRQPVEDRWIEDVRQYKGQFNQEDSGVDAAEGTAKYVNITRRKTTTGEAKFSDMILPTDDRNFSISTSVVPEGLLDLSPDVLKLLKGPKVDPQPMQPGGPIPGGPEGIPPEQQVAHEDIAAGFQQQPPQQPQASELMRMPTMDPHSERPENQAPQAPPGEWTDQDVQASVQANEFSSEDIAKAKCEAMQDEIDDQLGECGFEAVSRDVIHNGFLLGTGILKGPEIQTRTKRVWVRRTDEKGNSVHVLEYVQESKPGAYSVDPWDFFPDMTAVSVEDAEFIYERHWLTRKDVRNLAKNEAFLKESVKELLRLEPDKTPPNHLAKLREMSGLNAVGEEKRYVVWEYHGPVSKDDLILCGCTDVDPEDPLEEYEGVIWVSQGIVLRAEINPMETKDRPYSVFNLEKDETSVFGFGIPFLMRNPQAIVNATWQMILDNAGLSVGGQIIINDKIIEPVPVNGQMSWDIKPLKMWRLKDKRHKPQEAFHIFEFPNHQNELSAIFQIARQLADEESGIPLVAEGESAQHQTTTARGMEMLLNSHAIVMRRAVKHWDDDVTVPVITRFYDYNMQFNQKEEIKGDYQVDARGSSALLLKETQSRNILNLANFAQSPLLQGWFKFGSMAEKITTTMQLDADELVKSEQEYDEDMAAIQQQQQQQGGDPREEVELAKLELSKEKLSAEREEKQADRDFRAWELQQKINIETMKLANTRDISLEKAQSMIENTLLKGKIDRSKIADEAKIKFATGSGI